MDLVMELENNFIKQNERRIPKVLRLKRRKNTCKRLASSNYIENYEKSKINLAYEKNKTKYPKTSTESLIKILNSKLKFKSVLAPVIKLYLNDATDPTLAKKLKEYADKTKKKVKSLFNYITITEPTIKEDLFKLVFETTKSLDDTRESNLKIFYMPVMVAADKSFVDFHRELDYETYILTAMNMVADYFKDTTLGLEIYISVSKIMYLDQESTNFNDPQAFMTLRKFCDWSNRVRPDALHPDYYDVAILITRNELLGCKASTKILGATYSASACLSCKGCVVVRDTGLLLGVNIAHQLGHLLGLPDDDGESEKCPSEAYERPKFDVQYHHIMSPHLEHERLVWSECSRVAIAKFFNEGLGACLEDEPQRSFHRFPNILPGVMYDANMQCDLLYSGSKSCILNQEEFCQRLFCGFGNGTCFSYDVEPAQGTSCGMNKWCFNFECVHLGLRPAAVNGRWGKWKDWGPCSRTCGGGVQISRRVCNNPPPSFGGHNCLGPSHKEQMCNVQQCDPLEPSFRAVQCANFNHIPISGSFHKWRPVLRVELRDRCSLYCVNQDNVTARMEMRVEDGTPCRPGSNDVCVSGVCKAVGCDWVLSSDAVEDRCGICGGSGVGCSQISAIYNHSSLVVTNHTNSYIFITKIPKWSTKIRIYQMNPTSSCLAISRTAKNNTEVFIVGGPNGKSCGEFLMGPKSGYYTFLQNYRAYIVIKGPLPYDIKVYAIKCTTLSPIHYSYMRLYKEPRTLVHFRKPKHLDNHNFDWEYLDWTPCSARCEGGTERCRGRCVSLSFGLVDDHYCDKLNRPPDKIRVCNTQHCAVSWHVGPWIDNCPKHRTVHCMREARLWYEGDVIVDPKLCEGPSPVTVTNEDICVGNQIFDVQKVEQTTKYCFAPIEPLNRNQHPPLIINNNNSLNHNVFKCHNITTKETNENKISVYITTYKTTKNYNSTKNPLCDNDIKTLLEYEKNNDTIITTTDKIAEESENITAQKCRKPETGTTNNISIINNSTASNIFRKNISTTVSPKHVSENATFNNFLKSTNNQKTDLGKWKEFIKKYIISTSDANIFGNESIISIDDIYLSSTMPYSKFDFYNNLTIFNATMIDLAKDTKGREIFETQSPSYKLNEKMNDLINRINNIRKEINKDKVRVNKIRKGITKSKSKKLKRSVRSKVRDNSLLLYDKFKYKENTYSARNLRMEDKQILLMEPTILSNDSIYIIVQTTIGKYFINIFERLCNFTVLYDNVTYIILNQFYSTNDNVIKFTETLKDILKLQRNKYYKNLHMNKNDDVHNHKIKFGNSIRKVFSKNYLNKVKIKRQEKIKLKPCFECVNTLKKCVSKVDLTIHRIRNYDKVYVLKEKYMKKNIRTNSYLILHLNNDKNINKLIKSSKSNFITSNKVIEIEKASMLPNINIFFNDLMSVLIKNKNTVKKGRNQYKTKNVIIIEPKNVNNYFIISKQNEENKIITGLDIPLNKAEHNLEINKHTQSFPIKSDRKKRSSNNSRSKGNRRSNKNIGRRKFTKKQDKVRKKMENPTELNNSTCRFAYLEDEENIDRTLNVVVKIICGNNIVGCLSDNVYREVGDELPFLYKTINKP